MLRSISILSPLPTSFLPYLHRCSPDTPWQRAPPRSLMHCFRPSFLALALILPFPLPNPAPHANPCLLTVAATGGSSGLVP
eukprot:scaffold2449_cov79-Isochrysis_galbana.AAC.1